jgi:Protein kinase domain
MAGTQTVRPTSYHGAVPNETLRDGRFVVIGTLGEGAQGRTFDGVDKRVGQPVAIKRFDVRGATSWKDVDLAEREARVLQSLSHPRLPRYIDHFEEGGALYLVMEKIEGESLASLRRRGVTLSEQEVLRLLRDASEVLDYLHGRSPPVIHRDLKPGNVLLDEGHPVVIDFGIAHLPDTTRLTKTGLVMGTPGYVSPEIIEGRPASGATDVHAWGATVAFAATGRPPYGTGDFQTVFFRIIEGRAELSGVPPELLPLVTAALSTDPPSRPTARSLVSLCAASGANGVNGATLTLPDNGRPVLAPVRPPVVPVMPAYQRADWQQYRSPVQAAADMADLLPPVDYARPGAVAVQRPQPPAARPHDPGAGNGVGNGRPSAAPVAGLGVVSFAAAVAAVALAVLLPVAGTVIALGVISLLRAADTAQTELAERRSLRGARPSDLVLVTVTAPWTVVRALLKTAFLAPLALLVAVPAAIASVILVRAGTLPAALSWGAGAAVAMYCVGPGSRAPRRQLWRMSAAVVRTRGVLLVACISTMALALAVVSSAISQPPLIWPATSSTVPHLLPTINMLPSVGGALHSVQGWLLRHTVGMLHLP